MLSFCLIITYLIDSCLISKSQIKWIPPPPHSQKNLCKLVVFGRACAPVCCAHPSFWSHCHAQRDAACPPAYRSIAAFIYPSKLSMRSELDCPGRISFHWAKLYPAELHCIFLSYALPSWAPLNPNELHCTLLRYAVPLRSEFNWVTLHPIWAKLRPTSYAAIFELSWALLSYTAPLWATLNPCENSGLQKIR